MVYRYAEFAFPHVHCHHSKHREYRGKPLPGLWLQHEIEGVAIGTLTAQYAGLVMAYLLWIRYYGNLRKRIEWHSFSTGKPCTVSLR